MEDNVVKEIPQNEPEQTNQPQKSNKPSFGARVKEWFRKRLVGLKRRPNNIPFFLFLVTSLIYLMNLAAFSQTAFGYDNATMAGFPVFVNCLLSILIVVLHLNAFPKRGKKISWLNYILVYVFAAIMLAMDILYYLKPIATITNNGQLLSTMPSFVRASANVCITHIVFLALSVIALALLPLYSKLIMKINTSKELEGSQLNEVIESEDED